MRVLAIDPGTKKIGYAVAEGRGQVIDLLAHGTIVIESNIPDEVSLKILFEKIQDLIKEEAPEQMAVEAIFFSKNVKTAVAVSQARGVILLAGSLSAIKTFSYTPLEVKKAITGYGHAAKDQVQSVVKMLLKLDERPQDDAADAIALAVCHLNIHQLRTRIQKAGRS